MRDYKFRGTRLDNGEWVTGDLIRSRIADGAWINTHNALFGSHEFIQPVDPSTVGQCTGLKDKNGKEIYEGDVLGGAAPNDEPILPFEVKWDKQSACYPFEDDFDGYDYTTLGCATQMEYRFEVIGNIHEHPDLLKGGAASG